MGEKVRILRLLEYVGERSAIEKDLARRGVKGIHDYNSKYVIREAFLAPGFPETSTDLDDKMGYYLNPSDMSKEDFLQKYGKEITKQDFLNPDYDSTMMKVCLVDNGPFKAAAIGYSPQECEEFCRPTDMRPKRFFAVHPSDAKAHDCEGEAFFKAYWPEV